MNCLLHPQTQAAAACEYCAQPHCAACLRMLLGRRYCPACYGQVHLLATGRAAAGSPAAGTAGASPAEEAKPRRPRPALPGWLSALIFLAGFMLLEFLSGFGLVLLSRVVHALSDAPLPSHGRSGGVFDATGIGLPGWAAMMGFAGWLTCLTVVLYTTVMARALEKRSLFSLGLRWDARSGREAAWGLLLSTLLFVSVVGTGIEAGWYTIRGESSWLGGLLIALGGFVVLLPYAAVEEITLRGYVLTATSRSWGRAGALLGSSIAFLLLHGTNEHFGEQPGVWLGLFLAGLYLGSAYLLTGRLWLPIVLHTCWNLWEGPIFGLPVSGISLPATVFHTQSVGPALWTGGRFGPEAGLLLSVILLCHIGALWALRPLLRPASPPSENEDAAPQADPKRTYQAIPLG